MVRTWVILLLLAGCTSPTHPAHHIPDPPAEASACIQDTMPVPFSPPTMWEVRRHPFTVGAPAVLNLWLALDWNLPDRPPSSAMGILTDAGGEEAGRVMLGIDGPTHGSLEMEAVPGNWTLRLETQSPVPADLVRLSFRIRIGATMEACP